MKEKEKVIEGLSSSEIERYIERLTRNLYLSFMDSDIEKMKDYHNQISETSRILNRKYCLDEFIVRTDNKIASECIVYYKTKLDLLFLMDSVRELLQVYSDLHDDYFLLLGLVQLQKNFLLELAVHREVDVVERVFSKGNNAIIHFNKIVDDLKCKVESEVSDLKKQLLIFSEVSVASIIENYEEASGTIGEHEILIESEILEEIEITTKFLEMVSGVTSEADSLIEEVENYMEGRGL